MRDNLAALIQNYSGSFYLFDMDVLKKRVQQLRAMLPAGVSLCYAVKANTFVTGALADEVERFEICSPGETAICRQLGIPSEKMVISGVYKSYEYLREFISDPDFKGILTVESAGQFAAIKRLAEEYKRPVKILIRLTNGSQFGVNENDVLEMVQSAQADERIHICGLQYFSGTQKQSIKKLGRELETVNALIDRIHETCGAVVEELEFGPGFPVSYFAGDSFDEKQFLEAFSKQLALMMDKVRITLELGRSIAASCGRYFTKIVDIKTNKGQNYALVDGGMHQIAYYGQYMAMKQPRLSVWGKEVYAPEETWNICGSLCTMNDILVKQAVLPHIELGDVLCFEAAGAYCVTEGIALFLSRELPAVYLKDNMNGIRCVRRSAQTYYVNTPMEY